MKPLNQLNLKTNDIINDTIWGYNPLSKIEASKLIKQGFGEKGFQSIENEIIKGCSPCPDIVSNYFGEKPSIMFISTVYAGIHKYVGIKYDRDNDSWEELAKEYYKKIVLSKEGIYSIISDIYNLITTKKIKDPEICLTDLVKTVLYNKNGGTDKIHDSAGFREYFMHHEYNFLKQRLEQINNLCFIFTFKDVSTFFTIEGFKDLSYEIELLEDNSSGKVLEFLQYRKNKKPNLPYSLFTQSIAFKTILRVKGKEIYIIPLPHPASHTKGLYNRNWLRLENLFELLPDATSRNI